MICNRCNTDKDAGEFYASSSYICKACVKTRARSWYLANKERAKKRVAIYQSENRDKTRQWNKNYFERNKSAILEKQRVWSKTHPESRRLSRLKWNNKNRGRIAKVSSLWMKNNREKAAANWARYNAAKLRAVPKWANQFFIEEAYHLARLRTKVMGFPWHVDHIVPLVSKKVCGLHVEHNLQVIPGSLNMSKGNRTWPDMA